MPVERLGPGHFRQRGSSHLTVADDSNGNEFARLFLKTGIEVSAVSDFQFEAWRKLALNYAGAVPALVLKPASVAQRTPIADIMRALVPECIVVGRAEGADLDDSLIEA